MANFTDPRVTEKRFFAIPPQALTANGTVDGTITIGSTYCWKVGQIVTVVSTTVSPRRLKIKAVLSETTLKVGEINTPIYKFSNVSDLLTANSAMIELIDDSINSGSQASNRRPVIDLHEIQRQVYEEEPTVALRSHMVDWLGRSYSTSNPIPVQLSDGSINIGTVNAELEVQLSHQDNVPDAGDVADSVRIGDGTEIVQVNPDGSINVVTVPGSPIPPSTIVPKSIYTEISSVSTSSITTIQTYTVPVAKIATLERVSVSGTNIATYTVEVNSIVRDKKRTYFGGSLDKTFEFDTQSGSSIVLAAGNTVVVKVIHARPTVGDFNAKIEVIEIG